jgi:hypothetical protein
MNMRKNWAIIISHHPLAAFVPKKNTDQKISEKKSRDVYVNPEVIDSALRRSFYLPNQAHVHFPIVERMLILWIQILLGTK